MNFSISDALNVTAPTTAAKSATTATTTAPTAQVVEDRTLNIEQVRSTWLSLIGRFAQDKRVASIFMDAKLQLADEKTVQVQVINQMQATELEAIKPALTKELRQLLHNSRLTLTLSVAKEEYSTKAYTSEERYAVLSKSNQSLIDFTERLGLQLE